MTVVNAWEGGVTSSSARVRAKVTGSSTRLLVADNASLAGAAAYGPVVPVDGIATLDATGLDVHARYWWAVEDDAVVDVDNRGTFRTHPTVGSPASFSFAAATCAGADPETPGVGAVLAADRISNHIVFDAIRARALDDELLFFFHGGDINYYDLNDEAETHGITGGGSLANYLRAYDDVLLQPNQHRLYREVPLVYNCGGGGHDYGQPIGLARTLPGRDNCIQAWRARVPDYPTAAPSTTAGTYRSFQVGRVLFVVFDENADRDPDADVDGPNKTKLGAAQLGWLDSTLGGTSAEALVVLSGAQWERGGSANWGRYTHERDIVQQIFGDRGFLDRMVWITGDRHALEIVHGEDNPWGGFPIWHYASLDSPPGTTGPPGSPGNNRYGVVHVADTGSQITITGDAYIGASLWGTDSLAITTASAPPPVPPPTPPPVATTQIRRRVTWYGVNAVTGRIVAELPDVQGEVSRLLSAYQSAALRMPIPRTGPAQVPIQLAEQATAPFHAALVAVVNDLPTWMGWVLVREGGTDADLKLGCVTPEGYLTRRKVADRVFVDVDRAQVAAELVEAAEGIDGVGQGLGLTVEVTDTGDLISRTYRATDRQTVYDALRELAADGLEFTIDFDWVDADRTAVRKIARIGPRIGVDSTNVLFETTASGLFESQAGSDATYRLREDYSTGKGANWVVAYSSGEGEDQPASAPAVDLAALAGGAPIVEHHWQPASNIADQDQLDRHAAAELARLRGGAQVWEISARLDSYPRPGVDAQIGDDVSWLLTGHRHPSGVMGTGRMIGYTIDQQAARWRPILLTPGEEVVS